MDSKKDSKWVTVNEAIERTKKGRTTITRLCGKYSHTRHIKKENKRFLISASFLDNHYSLEDKKEANYSDGYQMGSEWVEQLRAKDKQIEALIERTRESNIIIQSLQNKLALPEGKREPDIKPVAKKEREYSAANYLLIGGLIGVIIGIVAYMIMEVI